jgi:xylulokinase
VSLTLGIDLGTSSVKAAAVGADGATVGEGAAEFETYSNSPLQAEQSTHEWLTAVSAAMRLLDAAMGAQERDWVSRIGAIGLTGQLPTLVALGAEGVLGHAITWKDGRADEWAGRRVTRGDHYARTGMPIDGRYLAPMWGFHFAERAREVRAILSAKDYLLYALTGESATEPSTAAGYGVYDLTAGRFAADLCEFWHLPPQLLPEVRVSDALGGELHAGGASLLGLPGGIPVSVGGADSACSAYAMAGLDERIVSVSFGSSAIIFGASAEARLDPSVRYLLTPHVQTGWYGCEMDLLSSGTGYRWLSGLFGWGPGELDRLAAASEPGARGVTFAPYLAGGEQGALWNPRLRGALAGLDLAHGHAEIARAYLEGVFFEVRRCVEVLAEALPIESVRVGGGMTDSPSTLQLLADVLGRPVAQARVRSPAAVGAALLARRLLGEAAPAMQAAGRVFEPEADAARLYDSLYGRYLARAAACA